MGQKLGKYIKNIRREKKISVKALSSQAGISKSYLDYIESGAREPQVEMLAKIAVVLQTPLETMINIQKKEQLEAALTKLAVDGVTASEEEFRAVARTADSGSKTTVTSLVFRSASTSFTPLPSDGTLFMIFFTQWSQSMSVRNTTVVVDFFAPCFFCAAHTPVPIRATRHNRTIFFIAIVFSMFYSLLRRPEALRPAPGPLRQ